MGPGAWFSQKIENMAASMQTRNDPAENGTMDDGAELPGDGTGAADPCADGPLVVPGASAEDGDMPPE